MAPGTIPGRGILDHPGMPPGLLAWHLVWGWDRYVVHYGERLRPAALPREMVVRGETFYKK
jgi:hypothetical protein